MPIIGDRVLITTETIPGTSLQIPSGTYGKILAIHDRGEGHINYVIQFVDKLHDSKAWNFQEKHFETKHNIMTAPDMDLSEILMAEKLIKELK